MSKPINKELRELHDAAQRSGKTRFFTGKPCVKGHIAERMVSTYRCVQCLKLDKPKYKPTAARKEKLKEYRDRNKKEIATKYKVWADQFRQRNGISAGWAYKKNRMASDPAFKTIIGLKVYFLSWLKREGHHKCSSVPEMLGCTKDILRTHIESQFREGMTWDNHGIGLGKWHIDHKVPLKSCGPELSDIKRAWHYTNLQPLWQEENIRKRHYL